MESKGNSRAAQKKRKLHQKRENVILNDLYIPSIGCGESQSETLTKRVKSDYSEVVFTRQEQYNHRLLDSIGIISLEDLLSIEDGEDNLLAMEKSSILLHKIIFPQNLTTFYNSFWNRDPVHCQNPSHVRDLTRGKIVNKKVLKAYMAKHVLRPKDDFFLFLAADGEIKSVDDDSTTNGEDFFKFLTQKRYCLELMQTEKFCDNMWKLLSSLEFQFNDRLESSIVYIPKTFECPYNYISKGCQFIVNQGGNFRATVKKNCCATEVQRCNEFSYVLSNGDTLYVPFDWNVVIDGCEMQCDVMFLKISVCEPTVKDLLEVVIPTALQTDNCIINRALPNNITTFMGVAASESDNALRNKFIEYSETALKELVQKCMNLLDPAVDQITKKFIARRLPVPLSDSEEKCSIARIGESAIQSYTTLRMVRPGIAVAIIEDGKLIVYHCMDNSRELYGNPLNPLEFELDDGPAIEMFLKAYPQSISVCDLYHPSEELDDKISIAQALFKEGFLIITDDTSIPVDIRSNDDQSDDLF